MRVHIDRIITKHPQAVNTELRRFPLGDFEIDASMEELFALIGKVITLDLKLHHTHACQSCGMVWRPALVATVGVRFLPGFKNP